MNNWENKLKEDGFIRVHRSYLINFNKIIKMEGNLIHIKTPSFRLGKLTRPLFLMRLKKSSSLLC
ncbi:LytTR family transcriptional regulator DNA-binding domain-containing protein [Chryseobacterium arthrosphaerae]|uniref:LytTR family transcriptional regulator DNA-binding domain-containing protein n=1 Tax=Chryseobacterium arthrosphaerae TaxID=651561 RepID=UPI001BAFAB3F|nr:LytTR family transcriptional regulator DNA-binding domain-containing protein [Chryseobacterium arthrosphaerae]